MLRNRSRAVTSNKQALMADHNNNNTSQTSYQQQQTQTQTKSKPSSNYFFGSLRFKAFTTHNNNSNNYSHDSALLSPTSTLETKPFFSLVTSPFLFHAKSNNTQNKHFSNKNCEAIGIGLVLNDPFDAEEEEEETSHQVVLGTKKLRVQIPPLTDFGIKTRSSHVSDFRSPRTARAVDQRSEDYTCVISHGPVPRTTHIFENCVVEKTEIETFCSCLSLSVNDNNYNNNNNNISDRNNQPGRSFLSFCHTCQKNLQQKIDIYIYRGEKAFCSKECRHREMLIDGMGNEEFDDHSVN